MSEHNLGSSDTRDALNQNVKFILAGFQLVKCEPAIVMGVLHGNLLVAVQNRDPRICGPVTRGKENHPQTRWSGLRGGISTQVVADGMALGKARRCAVRNAANRGRLRIVHSILLQPKKRMKAKFLSDTEPKSCVTT